MNGPVHVSLVFYDVEQVGESACWEVDSAGVTARYPWNCGETRQRFRCTMGRIPDANANRDVRPSQPKMPSSVAILRNSRIIFPLDWISSIDTVLRKDSRYSNVRLNRIKPCWTTHSPSATFHLRLPQMDLLRFNGDLSRCLSFRDTFFSMVYSNADVPKVSKL